MKKQRILALTLAATTALSMFGGISASAAKDTNDGFKAIPTVKPLSNTSWENIIADFTVDGVGEKYEAAKFYFEDFETKDKDKVAAAKQAVADFLNNASVTEAKTKAVDALKAAYGDTAKYETGDSLYSVSATRKTALEDFEKAKARINEIQKNYKYYEKLDLEYWGISDKEGDASGVSAGYAVRDLTTFTAKDKENSVIIFVTNELNRVADQVSPTTTLEERYNELLEEANSKPASDYTEAKYRAFVNFVSDAEYYAGKGNFAKAVELLNSALSTETIAPKYKDLEKALNDLFKSKQSSFEPYYKGDNSSKHVYLKKDYKNNRLAWDDFAGTSTKDGEKGAYGEAVEVLTKAKGYNTRKTLGQSVVDAALEKLNAAVEALDPSYTTPDWVVVYLEDALAKADAIVESDYRTSTKAWKDFVAAKEAVEKLLAAPAVKQGVAQAKVGELTAAQKALNNVRVAVPTALKDEAKALRKEAWIMLKNDKDVTFTQAAELDAAIKAYDEYDWNKATISGVEGLIKKFKAAIAGFTQKQGWYKVDNAWYYGKGDTNVTGWLNLQGTWYYLGTDGKMVSNAWRQINGQWYYFFESGKMVAGQWHKIGSEWFSFDAAGHMRTGWYKNPYNNNWFYLLKKGEGKEGVMVANKWMKINGKDYYFGADGAMAVNTVINGYKVGADGAWIK